MSTCRENIYPAYHVTLGRDVRYTGRMSIEWNVVTWYSKALAVVLFVGIAIGAFFLGREYERVMSSIAQEETIPVNEQGERTLIERAKNATYTIESDVVALKDGSLAIPAINSSDKITTQYFGNQAVGDVNGDDLPDIAFLLTQQTGGTGTFYYVAVLFTGGASYQRTNAVFIGDRVAPQTTEIRDGKIIVNYADRKEGEPMITRPSVGKSMYLVVKNGQLVKQ